MFQASGLYALLQWFILMSPIVGGEPCVSTQAKMTPFLTPGAAFVCDLPALPPRAVETPTTRATRAAMTRYFILTPFFDRALRTGPMGDCLERTGRTPAVEVVRPCRSRAEPGSEQLVHGNLAGIARHAGVDREGHPGVRVPGEHRRLRQRDSVRERYGNERVPQVMQADGPTRPAPFRPTASPACWTARSALRR